MNPQTEGRTATFLVEQLDDTRQWTLKLIADLKS